MGTKDPLYTLILLVWIKSFVKIFNGSKEFKILNLAKILAKK